MTRQSFKSTLRAGAALFTIVVAGAVAGPVMAQTAAPGQSASAAGLEEVVVTAQRRAENVQTVPVAVTALTSEVLAKNDIRDLSRVELLTPGFSFGKSGSDARPAIRGVRTENVAVSGDPTIGFFVDNVYRSRASQANEPFVDVERVEVQRGPQGTLYGRNTFGGNITVASKAPTDQLEGGVDLTVGSYERRAGTAYINVPVADWVQLRVAGLREKMDGYVEGTRSDLDIMSRDTSYLRTSLRLAPLPELEATLRYSYWKEEGTGGGAFGYRVGGVFLNPTTGAFDLRGTPYRVNADGLVSALSRDGIPEAGGRDVGFPVNPNPHFYPGDTKLEQDLEQHVLSANLSYTVGPVVLRSITGYVDYSVFRNADNDFSMRLGNVDGQEDKLDMFSQEFQIASADTKPLQWILGYYYYNEDIRASFFSSCPTAARNTPGCAFAGGLPETTSNAVFGQASYWVVDDKVRITGGIRYTEDEKVIGRYSALTDAQQRLISKTYLNQQFSAEFTKTTWRVGGEYHVTPANMLYAGVSTGFRSGGFNGGFFTNAAIPASFGPENVTAYEIGSKNRFLNNRLQLNVSIYYNEFEDLQVQNQFLIVNPAGGVTTTSAILNAAKAYSQGIEVELQAIPVDNLTVGVSGTVMEAKYDQYRNTPAPANYTGFVDYSGNKVPYSPDYKFTLFGGYDFDLGTMGTITPQATLMLSGSYFNTDTNTVLDKQDAFGKLDLRLAWRSADERYTAEAFVNNVTDEITMNRATFGSRGLNQSFDAPRMYGVKVGARF